MDLPPRKRGDILKYTIDNGKTVNIPDNEIEKYITKLGLSKQDAIDLWLADNDYEVDEEQQMLDEKAKAVKIQHDATATEPRKKSDKPRTVKVSDAKKELFDSINAFLDLFSMNKGATYSVLTENKLFQVNFGGETFKIDIIQQRKPKN